jgi:hypothetical protein
VFKSAGASLHFSGLGLLLQPQQDGERRSSAARNAANLENVMSNMSGAGLPQLVQEIKLASENIRKSDEANREELEGIKASVNELYKRTGRPGGHADSSDTDERKDAAAMVVAKHSIDVPRFETTEYQPSGEQVDEAVMAMRRRATRTRKSATCSTCGLTTTAPIVPPSGAA